MGNGQDTAEVVTKLYYAQLGKMKRLVAFKRGATLYYVCPDDLGGTVRTVDTQGNLVDDIRYHAFGATRSGGTNTPTDKRFTGQTLDLSSGLYYYGARYYDAAIGRFIQPDSIVPKPGNPQSLNRYSYTLNNPLKYVDPTGNDETDPDEGTDQEPLPDSPPGADDSVVDDFAGAVGDLAAGLAANDILPQRFDLYSGQSTTTRRSSSVMIINDIDAGGLKGQWIVRVDDPLTGRPHVNINSALAGLNQYPHSVPISAGTAKVIGGTTRVLSVAGKARVAVPAAVAADTFSLAMALQTDQGQLGRETKDTIGGIAGGWGGALAGAKGGAIAGGAIGSLIAPGPGTAIGGVIGGIMGGIGGGFAGSNLGRGAAHQFWR